MARDFAEMEREFLSGLKSETGKDLAEWMAAISAAGTPDRNATIDWLKARGFAFNRASWLERIHSNGGRPVYIDRVDSRPDAAAEPAVQAGAQARPEASAHRASRPAAEPSRQGPPVRSQSHHVGQPGDAAALEAVLAAAKGYRPLCMLLLDYIGAVLGPVEVVPVEGHLSLRAPAEFAVLAVSATELRLGLALGSRGFDALAQKARLKGPGSRMTHMVVLNDARQVGNALGELIAEAKKRVTG